MNSLSTLLATRERLQAQIDRIYEERLRNPDTAALSAPLRAQIGTLNVKIEAARKAAKRQ